MSKYCEFCSFCHYGDVPYCSHYEKTMTESQITHPTECTHFHKCVLGSCIDGRPYSPREVKNTAPSEPEKSDQLCLFDNSGGIDNE